MLVIELDKTIPPFYRGRPRGKKEGDPLIEGGEGKQRLGGKVAISCKYAIGDLEGKEEKYIHQHSCGIRRDCG